MDLTFFLCFFVSFAGPEASTRAAVRKGWCTAAGVGLNHMGPASRSAAKGHIHAIFCLFGMELTHFFVSFGFSCRLGSGN